MTSYAQGAFDEIRSSFARTAARNVGRPLAGKCCLLVEDRRGSERPETALFERTGAALVTAKTIRLAQEALAQHPWDLVIIDLSSLEGDGSAVAHYASARSPRPGILVVSEHVEPSSLIELHALGAITVHERELDDNIDVLAQLAFARALRIRATAKQARRADTSETPATQFANGFGLTRREQEVFGLLVAGIAPKEIAVKLSISDVTVRRHTENASRKCGVQNQRELLALFARTMLRRERPRPTASTTI